MRLLSSTLTILLLAISAHDAQAKFTVQGILSDIGTFFPPLAPAINYANIFFNNLDNIKDAVQKPTEPPKQVGESEDGKKQMSNEELKKLLNAGVNSILLSIDKGNSELKDLGANLQLKEINLMDSIRELKKHMSYIDKTYYDTFLDLYSSADPDKDDIEDFVKIAIRGQPNVLSLMKEIAEAFEPSQSMLSTLADYEQSKVMACLRGKSSMQAINDIYNEVKFSQMRSLIVGTYAFMNRYNTDAQTCSKGGPKIKALFGEFVTGLRKIQKQVRKYMLMAPRDFHVCGTKNLVEGETYLQLDPIFQTYIASQKSITTTNNDGQKINVEDWPKLMYIREGHDLCNTLLCQKTLEGKECKGILRNCQCFDDTNPKNIKSMVCIAEPNSKRRYESLLFANGTFVGRRDVCYGEIDLGRSLAVDRSGKLTGGTLKNCLCTCDEKNNNELNRYFNLRPVFSDIADHNVITGVKLVRDKNLIHIKIRQGKLQEDGRVDPDTVAWKNITKYSVSDANARDTIDYYRVAWNRRQVDLNEQSAPNNTVLTGIRFREHRGALKLQVHYTAFDFASGKLNQDPNKSAWVRLEYDSVNRKPVKFSGKLPTGKESVIHEGFESVEFTTSDFETDFGQAVVPYIDAQEVVSSSPTLLSGAGLIYRTSSDSAGFIAMKLKTYDFVNNIAEISDQQQSADEYVNKRMEGLNC